MKLKTSYLCPDCGVGVEKGERCKSCLIKHVIDENIDLHKKLEGKVIGNQFEDKHLIEEGK